MTMDGETKQFLKNMDHKLDNVGEEINLLRQNQSETTEKIAAMDKSLAEHIKFNEGLELNPRLRNVENDLPNKATWSGLRYAIVTVIAAGTVGVSLVIAFQ